MVEGAYGTGKSHAALTVKSLLEASDDEVRAYFDDYGNVPTEAQLQAEIDKFPSDELTDEDCLVMLKSCLK